MLFVTYDECYIKALYAEYCYAKFINADCCYVECHGANLTRPNELEGSSLAGLKTLV
jgi:hypothetical protein